MKPAAFDDLVTCLTGDQPPRVWSLLVTVFGELAQDSGARVSGALLRHLTDLIGIKPEAVRVALHRLRKDGWIDSIRQGRTSSYVLTDWGRAQSAAASPRIYATEPMTAQAWLVIREPGQPGTEDSSGVTLAPNMLLTTRPPRDANAFLAPVPEADGLPAWMAAKVCDEALCTLAGDLDTTLSRLIGQLDQARHLTPLQRATLRVLVVHAWRRVVLRTPLLPDPLFPPDWRGTECRQQVAALLAQFPRVPLDTLEDALSEAG